MADIDWNDPTSSISKYFTVKECLWLPSWGRMANETQDGVNDTIKSNLIDLCQSMDIVREYFDKPINVHCTYRPQAYNQAIGGALHSAHSDGQAMDFDVSGMNCDAIRKEIVDNDLLESWVMRMEDNKGGNWIHLDRRELKPSGNRFFIP